jgi:hypothetical protein
MAKVLVRRDDAGNILDYAVYCTACRRLHYFPNDGRWSFNGDVDRPTFSPSMNEAIGPIDDPDAARKHGVKPGGKARCHFIVTDGEITYCSDCTHHHCAKRMPLEEIPDKHTSHHRNVLPGSIPPAAPDAPPGAR